MKTEEMLIENEKPVEKEEITDEGKLKEIVELLEEITIEEEQ